LKSIPIIFQESTFELDLFPIGFALDLDNSSELSSISALCQSKKSLRQTSILEMRLICLIMDFQKMGKGFLVL